jgi:hypothetical protein
MSFMKLKKTILCSSSNLVNVHHFRSDSDKQCFFRNGVLVSYDLFLSSLNTAMTDTGSLAPVAFLQRSQRWVR